MLGIPGIVRPGSSMIRGHCRGSVSVRYGHSQWMLGVTQRLVPKSVRRGRALGRAHPALGRIHLEVPSPISVSGGECHSRRPGRSSTGDLPRRAARRRRHRIPERPTGGPQRLLTVALARARHRRTHPRTSHRSTLPGREKGGRRPAQAPTARWGAHRRCRSPRARRGPRAGRPT